MLYAIELNKKRELFSVSLAHLLRTTAAELLSETKIQPIEQAERISVLLSQLSNTDRDWVERVVRLLAERCQVQQKKARGSGPKS